ncbi:double-strand-break repair protein rad21 homolog isoform X2 [Liolophura sinensis]|uniref:double-strand-break repair protein rad21 homolog isoform X2 n=1 Tax=Liolophura sinensis TaxID=3198878 RepID=UPI003158101F
MFYAHFVLSKKGPLARIWLAAHWDKKLTKAHVFETNIDSSVDAILQPKVKLALRTSGHLLLGVVRIYSRKAKYLLADCNEAFVKIKMAFRPGVVDLPEENREAAVTAITLQENFHDFDTTLADLNDIDVQAQFAVNQSRPEEITMREDLGNITLVGDDGFGDSGIKDFGGEVDDEEIFYFIYGYRTTVVPIDWEAVFVHCLERTFDKFCSKGNKQKHKDVQNNNFICDNGRTCSSNKSDKQDKPYLEKVDSGIGLESDPGNWSEVESDDEMSSNWASPQCSVSGSLRGDVGFDDREILRDVSHMDDSLYKSPEPPSIQLGDKDDKSLESSLEKPMDVDLPPPVMDDGFGGAVDDGFVGGNFMDAGGLFEDPPLAEVSMPPEVEAQGTSGSTEPVTKDSVFPAADGQAESAPRPEPAAGAAAAAPPAHEQTTLVHNEAEEFALEPIDVTSVQGAEKKGKRKRKLIVDDQKGIPSESMKMQLSDTTDIVTTLDLAPPTKKLMHWKETGGVEKLFALPGRPINSKAACKLYGRNLVTKPMKEEATVFEEDRPDFESPELPRAEQTMQDELGLPAQDQSTLIEEPSIADVSRQSRRSNRSVREVETPRQEPAQPLPVEEPSLNTTDLLTTSNIGEGLVDLPAEPSVLEPIDMGPKYLDDEPPSIAPFSVAPPSVAPPSVAPPSVAPAFEDLEPDVTDAMPETEEQEERRLNKRSQQMQMALETAFRYNDVQSFKDLTRRHNRKQVCSKFYTLLTLKKLQVLHLQQDEPFGDILLTKGPKFGTAV